jgi:protein subunit release factor A
VTRAEFDEAELKVDVFRKVGPDADKAPGSAVRITHQPTGTTVFVDEYPTAEQNRTEAMRRLRRRLDT